MVLAAFHQEVMRFEIDSYTRCLNELNQFHVNYLPEQL